MDVFVYNAGRPGYKSLPVNPKETKQGKGRKTDVKDCGGYKSYLLRPAAGKLYTGR